MRGKVLLGAATAAALFGLVTEANAVPQFQLRIVSGTYDHTFVSIDNTAVAGTVSAALNNINGGGGNKFMSGPTGTTLIQGTYDYTPTLTGTDFYFALSVPDIYHNSKTAGTISSRSWISPRGKS